MTTPGMAEAGDVRSPSSDRKVKTRLTTLGVSWYISKKMIVGLLSVIYFVAFYGAYKQNVGLMGRHGIKPAYTHFSRLVWKYNQESFKRYAIHEQQQQQQKGNGGDSSSALLSSIFPSIAPGWWLGFCNHPSLFWFLVAWREDETTGGSTSIDDNFIADKVMSDQNLLLLYKSGMTLSCLVLLNILFGRRKGTRLQQDHSDMSCDPSSMLIQLALWLLYFTVVTTAEGTSFYSYGWESQLLETGFLSIFLCESVLVPTVSLLEGLFGFGSNEGQDGVYSPSSLQPHPEVLWLFRWLCFRISIGAGLIKIRGDSCWTDKTCLWYHFETQPIPSPLSFIFHFLPKWMLSRAVDLDLFVQVYTSWFVLLPTSMGIQLLDRVVLNFVRLGGFIQIGFMINIIMSGNFAFLNHLTIIPALACLDDSCWSIFRLSRKVQRRTESLVPTPIAARHTSDRRRTDQLLDLVRPRRLLNWLFLGLTMILSQPVIENLLQVGGQRQKMNASYDSFRLVGSYGAFGSVGTARYEPIVQIAYEKNRMNTSTFDWIEIEFPCKPGSVTRRPCVCAPYHYRVDWNIWFIGFKPHKAYLHHRESWLFDLIAKLLQHQPDDPSTWLDLLDSSSASILRENYANGRTPALAKVDMYHYRMASPLGEILKDYTYGWFSVNGYSNYNVTWWNRTYEEPLIPVVEFDPYQKRLVEARET